MATHRPAALLSCLTLAIPSGLSAQAICPDPGKGVDFLVDGLTGEVRDLRLKDAHFVGETVVVGVHRANLLNFGYLVSQPPSEEIVVTYGVVGLGTVTNTGSIGTGQVEAAAKTADSLFVVKELVSRVKLEKAFPTVPGDAEWALRLVGLAQALSRVSARQKDAEKDVLNLMRPVTKLDGNVNLEACQRGWGTALTTTADDFDRDSKRVLDSLGAIGSEVRKVREEMQGYRLKAIAVNTALPNNSPLRIDLGTFPSLLDSLLTALDARQSTSVTSINTAATTVRRWRMVLSTAPDPYREFRLAVNRSNRRQAIVVRRYSASGVGKVAQVVLLPVTGSPPTADTVAIATLSYDSHGYSRFNLSAGLAGLYTPNSETFAAVQEINGYGLVETRVRRSSSTRVAVRPALFLGIYWRRVDELDTHRPKVNGMLTIGAEIANSSRNYLLGGALDSRIGVQVGAGVTLYESRKLGEGWTLGQLIPVKEDGSPVVAAVPTSTRRQAGLYFYLGFRPILIEKLAGGISHLF